MVTNRTLGEAIDADSSNGWADGECSRCGREARILETTALDDYDALCLVCADSAAEDGDMTALVGGER